MIKIKNVIELILKEKKKFLLNTDEYVANKNLEFIVEAEKENIETIVDIFNRLQAINNLNLVMENTKFNETNIAYWEINKEVNVRKENIKKIKVKQIDEKWIAKKLYENLVFKNQIKIVVSKELLEICNPDSLILEKLTNHNLVVVDKTIIISKDFKPSKIKSLNELHQKITHNLIDDKDIWGTKISEKLRGYTKNLEKFSQIEKIVHPSIDKKTKELIKFYINEDLNLVNASMLKLDNLLKTDSSNLHNNEFNITNIINLCKKNRPKWSEYFIDTSIYSSIFMFIKNISEKGNIDNKEKFKEILSAYRLCLMENKNMDIVNPYKKIIDIDSGLEQVRRLMLNKCKEYYSEESYPELFSVTKEEPRMKSLLDYLNLVMVDKKITNNKLK